MNRSLALVLFAISATGCATVSRPVDPLTRARAELREANRSDEADAVTRNLHAAERALAVATDDAAPAPVRAEATALYNRAVAQSVVAAFTAKSTSSPTYDVAFTPPRGVTRLLIAADIPRKHLKTDTRRTGFGGALVGVMDGPDTASPNRPPRGYAVPFTAVAEFGASRAGRTPVTIRLLDPNENQRVRIAGAERPLAGDFSAPLAFYPHPNELVFGFFAMLRSDRSIDRSGLWFYEPYDPKKIPVLFIHGLMSSPHAWLQVVNQLAADPDFRRRYQVWSYFYPTGAPIAGNALFLRQTLAEAAARYNLRNNLVIVGHSMGGILTRMQVTNPGRALWNGVFGAKADQIFAEIPADSILKQALLFRANSHVARVVFVATPHRGSTLANLRISALAARLIRMPVTLARAFETQVGAVMRLVDPTLRGVPTSVQGLSPRNRLLVALAPLPLTVPADSIIGDRGKSGPLEASSDGVVPYWSSHLPAAESELVVPTGHDAFNHPRAITRLREILDGSPRTKRHPSDATKLSRRPALPQPDSAR